MKRFSYRGGRPCCCCCCCCSSSSRAYGSRYTRVAPVTTCWRRGEVVAAAPLCLSHAIRWLHGTSRRLHSTVAPPQPSAQQASSSSSSSSSPLFAATDTSSRSDGSGGGNGGTAVPPELQFHESFLLSEEDVHYVLLHEAHVKHGVLLNVPPQLSPGGTPPEVPELILPAAQVERMRGMKLAYEPTHLPPPLHTTGSRQLVIDNAADLVTTTVTKKTAPATTVQAAGTPKGAGSSATTTVLVRRLPSDPTMRFHCTACGKAFRLEFSADHHVKLKHPSDAAAAVAAGPGAGEIIEEAASVAAIPTSAAIPTPPSSSLAAEASAAAAVNKANTSAAPPKSDGVLSGGVSAVKTPYNKAVLALPSEELVDALLKDVWDVVATQRDDVPKKNHPSAYVPFDTVVEGTADRRQDMDVQVKPTARATPEGAAPGIKKPGMLSSGAMTASRGRAQGMLVPIKELVKRYPNPFGDSPNAVLQELENEPVNPFIPQEELTAQLQAAQDGDDIDNPALASADAGGKHKGDKARSVLTNEQLASRPSLARSATQRRFTCPLCAERRHHCSGDDAVPSFRLLDALLDHVETAHDGEELTDAQMHALYETQRKSAMYVPKSALNGDGGSGTEEGRGDCDDPNTGNSRSVSASDALKAAAIPELLQKAAPPAAVEAHAMSVHVRAGSNTVLLGRIADVQHGFLGAMAVTQYVLEVSGDSTAPAEGDPAVAAAAAAAAAPTSAESEKELIVIRCMGDNFPAALLKEQVKLGSTVLVQGTLRMNRHIDDASKRLHAYPFVQVVPPLGCVKVVG